VAVARDIDVLEVTRIGEAGIVDQTLGRAEARLGGADRSLDGGEVGDIRPGIDRGIVAQLGQLLDVARDQQQLVARLGEGTPPRGRCRSWRR
jgi:hypothetical protein